MIDPDTKEAFLAFIPLVLATLVAVFLIHLLMVTPGIP